MSNRIVFTYNDLGTPRFMALVHGDEVPDTSVLDALQETGGSWNNDVTWLSGPNVYMVMGIHDDDPNYGDNPRALELRLGRVVGSASISLTIIAPDGPVFSEANLIKQELMAMLANA